MAGKEVVSRTQRTSLTRAVKATYLFLLPKGDTQNLKFSRMIRSFYPATVAKIGYFSKNGKHVFLISPSSHLGIPMSAILSSKISLYGASNLFFPLFFSISMTNSVRACVIISKTINSLLP